VCSPDALRDIDTLHIPFDQKGLISTTSTAFVDKSIYAEVSGEGI